MALTKIPANLLDTSSHVDLLDNERIRIGTGNDLQLYHTGGFSVIKEAGTGDLEIQTNGSEIQLTGNAGTDYMLRAISNGAVKLYYDNGLKLETDSSGINVTGGIDVADITATGNVNLNSDNGTLYFGAGADLRIYHDGGHARLRNTTGNFNIQADDFHLTDSSNSILTFRVDADGATDIRYNGVTKMATTAAGATVTGTLTVTGDLDITGNVNSASVTDLDVTDKTITVGAGQTEANSSGSGIIVDGSNASMLWAEATDEFKFNKNIATTEGNQLKFYRPGNSAYGSLFMDTGEKLYIRNSYGNKDLIWTRGGYLGIGTSTPENTLDLGVATQGRGLTFTKYSNLISEYSNGSLWLSSNFYPNPGATGYKTGATGNFGAAAIRVHGTGGGSNSGIIQFYTDPNSSKTADAAFTPTERMRIDESGKVGIDETTPLAKLHVVGGRTNGTVYNTIIAAGGANSTDGSGARIILTGCENDPLARGTVIEGISTGTGNSHKLNFKTNNGSSTPTTRMTIGHTGNVGIGTENPAQKLHTAGTSQFDDTMYFATRGLISWGSLAGGTGFGIRAESGNGLSLGSNGAWDKLVIDTAGEVGIGTTNPGSKLHVNGGHIRAENTGTDAYFFEGIRNGAQTTLRIYDNSNNLYIDSHTNMNFRVNQTGGGSGGNFGFGGGNAIFSGKIQADTTDSNFYNRLFIKNGSHGLYMGQWDGSNHRIEGDANRPLTIQSYHSGGITLGISGASRLVVTNTNVSVTGNFVTSGEIQSPTFFSSVASGGGAYQRITHQGNETWTWAAQSGTGNDDYLDVGLSGGLRSMSWHEDGKVGVGDTTPTTGGSNVRMTESAGFSRVLSVAGNVSAENVDDWRIIDLTNNNPQGSGNLCTTYFPVVIRGGTVQKFHDFEITKYYGGTGSNGAGNYAATFVRWQWTGFSWGGNPVFNTIKSFSNTYRNTVGGIGAVGYYYPCVFLRGGYSYWMKMPRDCHPDVVTSTQSDYGSRGDAYAYSLGPISETAMQAHVSYLGTTEITAQGRTAHNMRNLS